jgi:hypothetical protein
MAGKPLTTEQVAERHVEYVAWVSEYRPDVTVLGVYEKSIVAILHRCNKCSREWDIRPNDIKSGKGCGVCAGKRKPSPEEYEQRLLDDGRGFVALEPYVTAHTLILHRCPEGHEIEVAPTNLQSGQGCRECANNQSLKDDYPNWLRENRAGWKLLEEYMNTDTPILHECPEGHKNPIAPSKLKRAAKEGSTGCIDCRDVLSAERFQARSLTDEIVAARIAGKGIALKGHCKGAKDRVEFECLSCGWMWDTMPSCILNNDSGCPQCAQSGFDPSKPAMLYIAEHSLTDGRIRVNVGITNRTFEDRYSSNDLQTVICYQTIEGHGVDIQALEKTIHASLADHIDPDGLGLEKKKGSKECFNIPYETALAEVLRLSRLAVGARGFP